MELIFLCSPYRGNVDENVALAKKAAVMISNNGKIPIAPHLIFPQFLDDTNENDRTKGIQMGLILMNFCSEMCVVCNEVTEGMTLEIKRARDLRIKIRFYNSELEVIDDGTYDIDQRLGEGLKQLIKDVNSNRPAGTKDRGN